jgi:hypothetical protein
MELWTDKTLGFQPVVLSAHSQEGETAVGWE